MIDIQKLEQARAFIEQKFGYRIENLDLVHEAIDTTGLCIQYSTEFNRRLAIVGDKVLDMAMIAAWYPTGRPIGICNKKISSKLCNANLVVVAKRIELDRHLVLHPGHREAATDKTLATGMEAVFGAIYQDCKDISNVAAAMHAVGIDIHN